MFRNIEPRTNPSYKYDEVLGDVNFNFSNISQEFLALSGGTVTGDTIFTVGVTASTLTLTAETSPLNLPIFISDPISPVNGDVWVRSGITGNAILNIRIGGLTKGVEFS